MCFGSSHVSKSTPLPLHFQPKSPSLRSEYNECMKKRIITSEDASIKLPSHRKSPGSNYTPRTPLHSLTLLQSKPCSHPQIHHPSHQSSPRSTVKKGSKTKFSTAVTSVLYRDSETCLRSRSRRQRVLRDIVPRCMLTTMDTASFISFLLVIISFSERGI